MDGTQLVAVVTAGAAAVVDVRSRRIPNWLTGGMLLFGLLAHGWLAGGPGVLAALGGAVLGAALLLPFYVMRAMGAGDVKLLAALGAVLGPQVLVSVAIYAAVAGGIMSVLILAARGRLGIALGELYLQRRSPTRSGLTAPYGVAIASGVFLSLLLPSVLG